MKKVLKLILAFLLYVLDDVCYFAGVACVAYGIGCFYPPAAYIAVGVGLVAYALLISRK